MAADSASRILAEFRDTGIISYQPRGREVTIEDVRRLREVAGLV